MLKYVDKYNKYKYKYKNLKNNISGGGGEVNEPYIFYQDIQWANEFNDLAITLQKIKVAKHIEEHIEKSNDGKEVIIKEEAMTKYTDEIYTNYKETKIGEYHDGLYNTDDAPVNLDEAIKKVGIRLFTNSKYLLRINPPENTKWYDDINIIKQNFYDVIKEHGNTIKDRLKGKCYDEKCENYFSDNFSTFNFGDLKSTDYEKIDNLFILCIPEYGMDSNEWRKKKYEEQKKCLDAVKKQMDYVTTGGLMDDNHFGLKGFEAWTKNFINDMVKHIKTSDQTEPYNFYIMGDSTIDYSIAKRNILEELDTYTRKAIFKKALKSEMGEKGEVFMDVVGGTGFLQKDSSFSLEKYKTFQITEDINTMALPAFITLLNELIKAEVININVEWNINTAPYLLRLIKNFFIDQKEKNNKYTHFAFIGFGNDIGMYIKGSYGQELFDFKYLINMIKIVKKLVYFIVTKYDEINKYTHKCNKDNMLTSLEYNI